MYINSAIRTPNNGPPKIAIPPIKSAILLFHDDVPTTIKTSTGNKETIIEIKPERTIIKIFFIIHLNSEFNSFNVVQ